jgi:predicted ATP-grasp superfamily ATP-dependent carboligase
MSKPGEPRAIVVGSGVVSIGVINDLTADGIRVAHISPKPDDLALHSRWPESATVLDPEGDLGTQLLDALAVLPTTDPLVRAVSRHLPAISQRFVTPVLPWPTMYTIINKAELYAAARAAGIPTPRIIYGEEIYAGEAWMDDFKFPVIVKPSQTPEFFAHFKVKALEAETRTELRRYLAEVRNAKLDVMVSEIIPGGQSSLMAYRAYVDRDGNTLAEMCSEKVRSHPPRYGVGVVQRTIPLNETLCDQGRRLLKALEFKGFASTEYKYDARDQTYKLIEINPRPALVQRMFRKAGINFAKLTVDDLTGNLDGVPASYREGIYSIQNISDLYHLKPHLKRGLPGFVEFFAPYCSGKAAFLVPPIRDGRTFIEALRRFLKSHRKNRQPKTTAVTESL